MPYVSECVEMWQIVNTIITIGKFPHKKNARKKFSGHEKGGQSGPKLFLPEFAHDPHQAQRRR